MFIFDAIDASYFVQKIVYCFFNFGSNKNVFGTLLAELGVFGTVAFPCLKIEDITVKNEYYKFWTFEK